MTDDLAIPSKYGIGYKDVISHSPSASHIDREEPLSWHNIGVE